MEKFMHFNSQNNKTETEENPYVNEHERLACSSE